MCGPPVITEMIEYAKRRDDAGQQQPVGRDLAATQAAPGLLEQRSAQQQDDGSGEQQTGVTQQFIQQRRPSATTRWDGPWYTSRLHNAIVKTMTFMLKKMAMPSRVKVQRASPVSPPSAATEAAKRQPKQQYSADRRRIRRARGLRGGCQPTAAERQSAIATDVRVSSDERGSWFVEEFDLQGGKQQTDRIGDGQDPKTQPHQANVPGDLVAAIVVELRFRFDRCSFRLST